MMNQNIFEYKKMLTKSNTEWRAKKEEDKEGSDKKICRRKSKKDPSRIMENNKNQHYREKKCSRNKICILIRWNGKSFELFFPCALSEPPVRPHSSIMFRRFPSRLFRCCLFF